MTKEKELDRLIEGMGTKLADLVVKSPLDGHLIMSRVLPALEMVAEGTMELVEVLTRWSSPALSEVILEIMELEMGERQRNIAKQRERLAKLKEKGDGTKN